MLMEEDVRKRRRRKRRGGQKRKDADSGKGRKTEGRHEVR